MPGDAVRPLFLIAVAALLFPHCTPATLRSPAQPASQQRGPGAAELILMPRPAHGVIGTAEISPSGTRYAYEVELSQRLGQIWVLDVTTRTARLVTSGPGRRMDPTWSPDGRQIAFWDSELSPAEDAPQRDGIWIVDLEDGREHSVFRLENEHGFVHNPQWVGQDSILFSLDRGYLSGGSEFWIVRADGTGARQVDDPNRSPVRSPTGTRRAYFYVCCGTWSRGLWISSVEGEGKRCVAGPLEYGSGVAWSPDARRLFFTGTQQRDSLAALWMSEIELGGARRIETPPGKLNRMSMSATGVLTVQIHTSQDSTLLWLAREPTSLPLAGDSIPACPTAYPALVAFARGERLTGELRIRETFRLPEYDFVVFAINYDFAGPGYNYRTAVKVGSHVGWLGGPCDVGLFGDHSCRGDSEEYVTFRPRPDEDFLWSAPFLGRLAELDWDQKWVRLLLRDPALPVVALESLLAHEEFDTQLVEDPRVQGRPAWLLRIRGRQGEGSRVGEAAIEALWRQGVEIVHDPGTPWRLILQFAKRVPRHARPDSLAAAISRALLAHPRAGRDPEVLVHLARFSSSADSSVFRTAGRRLLDDPSVSASVLERAVTNIAADPLLAERLFRDPRVRDNPGALLSLARTPWGNWSVAERARQLLTRRSGPIDRPADASRTIVKPFVPPAGPRQADHYGPPLFLLLKRMDPVFEPNSPRLVPEQPGGEIGRLLCQIARSGDTSEADLVQIAEGVVYATATRVASCLLENPRAAESTDMLRMLASMIDVNHDPRFPEPGAPTIAETRSRAGALLGRLDKP